MEILPSASNPADLLSCGVAVGALVDECSIWWKGPKWLCRSADMWPVWSRCCCAEDVKELFIDL